MDWKGNKVEVGLRLNIDLCNNCICSYPERERKYCTEGDGKDGLRDCSLYTCEDEAGRAVKEGVLFIPKGDCNERICKNGRPSDDCWNWGPGNNHKKTNCIDCDKKYPGCIDKDGNMYRHGDSFVPKGDCNRCTCNHGQIGACTRMGCPGRGRG